MVQRKTPSTQRLCVRKRIFSDPTPTPPLEGRGVPAEQKGRGAAPGDYSTNVHRVGLSASKSNKIEFKIVRKEVKPSVLFKL
jgi:hypothetical protein